jgi:hypothetical protein
MIHAEFGRKSEYALTVLQCGSNGMRLRNPKLLASLLLCLAAVLISCGHTATNTESKPAPVESVREIPSPAGMDSAQPNLATGPDGTTYLSWIENTDDGVPILKFATAKGDKWSDAQTIVKGEDLVVNYADFPSLLPLNDGVLAGHWMTSIRGTDGYRINVAFSRDGGKTWGKPVVPHRDHTSQEHGFVSMTAMPDGGLGTIWLDSRKLKGPDDDSGDVAMMFTTVSQDGKLGPETTIDGRVCECCQPTAVHTANGLLAVYRDRSDKEIRDIATVRYDGKKWSEPKNVYPDNWMINGCPINGPAIAASQNQIAVAWFTAPDNKAKVQLAFSSDGGDTFGQPVQIDEGNPIGRVGVVELDSGSAIVSWLERGDKMSQLRARRVDKDGIRHPSFLVGTTSSGTSGGFPRIERNGNSVIFAWTDTDASRVRTAVLDAKN